MRNINVRAYLLCALVSGAALAGTAAAQPAQPAQPAQESAAAQPAQESVAAQKYYYEDIFEPFFALDPTQPGMYRNQRPGSKDSLFAAVKPKDGFRVFILGGSIAALLQYRPGASDDLISAMKAALPTKKVEVINCGMAGYDSYREALIEQEILEYSPDLIVFLTGHNEGVASAPVPIWVMRAQERLSKLKAYRALVSALRPGSEAAPVHTDERADKRDAEFERNLTANLRHARERSVPVAVVMPPRNWREPAENGRSLYDLEFLPGWLSFLRRDYASARKLWKESLSAALPPGISADSHKAFTLGFIARSEEKLGLAAEAVASFEQAALFDRASICGGRCQAILRRVAGQEGGFIVEADRMFRALAHPRMPGMETFNDRMHWKPQFNCLMASELIASMRKAPKLGALPWDEARIQEISASCQEPGGPGNEEDARRIMGYVLVGLSGAELNRLSTITVFYLQAIREHHPDWFNDVPALLSKTPEAPGTVLGYTQTVDAVLLPRLYRHVGEVLLLEKDFSGAAQHFMKALALEPKAPWTSLSLAVAVTLGGDKKRGFELLKEVSAHPTIIASALAVDRTLGLGGADAVSASNPEYWLAKAEKAAASGNKAEGLAALKHARAAKPEPRLLLVIAQYYRLFRETGEFLKLADALTAAFPQNADVWLMVAEASFGAGKKEAGLAALARAEPLATTPAQRRLVGMLKGGGGGGGGPLARGGVKEGEVKYSPSHPEYWLEKAAAAAEAKNKPEGMAALARALAASPQPHHLLVIGQNYRMLREEGEFLKFSDALTAAYPKDADVWLMVAEASLGAGKKEAGLAALARAEALATTATQRRLAGILKTGFKSGKVSEGGRARGPASEADGWLKKASAAVAAKNKPDGMAALSLALAAKPEPHELLVIGQTYLAFREAGEFLKLSDALSAAFPTSVDVWLMIAEASFGTGKKDAGLAAIARAEKLKPNAAQRRLLGALKAGGPPAPAGK